MTKIFPSLLSADFSKLNEAIVRCEKGNADGIHLDIMDGHFVPNITFGPVVIKDIRNITDLPFEAHLMIENPTKYIPNFIDAGSDIITLHIETLTSKEDLKLIKKEDKKAGVAISPDTQVDTIIPYLDIIDFILVMTVYPGFAGQKFMAEMLPKIETIKQIIKKEGLQIEIGVDGGINIETAQSVIKSGADVLVAASAVFNGPIEDNIRKLKDVCNKI